MNCRRCKFELENAKTTNNVCVDSKAYPNLRYKFGWTGGAK